MAKKEVNTDFWVRDLLKEADIKFDAQGSCIKEIDDALKTASKRGTGKVGFPEFIAVVKDFLIVIENKADVSFHVKKDEKNLIDESVSSILNYAVNGALFYAKHLAKHTNFKKIIAIGISGNEKRHRISPIFVNERGHFTQLSENINTLMNFSQNNIDEYYISEILKEKTDFEKDREEILKETKELHEDLRNYGNIQDKDKPLIVSGILLALKEIEFGNFSLDSLVGDKYKTDGAKIYDAIADNLNRANVSPEVKKDKLLSQFLVIKDTAKINEINQTLGKTPLKHYAEFLYKNIYQNIRFTRNSEDYLGLFYGEFMSYSGGDGQSLGIILTPPHITELFCDLLDIKADDRILDPCCGTAGFLIAAMHKMLTQTDDVILKNNIKKNQLFGVELQSYMFTIATTNMILRGDGKSNLENFDFLTKNSFELQKQWYPNIGMMNPPYSQGSKQNPNLYEIAFTEHLLNSVTKGGKVAVIVPQSSVTGKTKEEKNIKANILKYHTLEGVITLNKNTFYGVGTNPCIAIFTAGISHNKDKICKFINFEDDGYEVAKHIGLIKTPNAKDKKQYLLDVWFDKIKAPTKFCAQTTIEADDEWLHSFYYFNDEIPNLEDFQKTIADYLTFEVNMITHGREYLFENSENLQKDLPLCKKLSLDDCKWGEFLVGELFEKIEKGKCNNQNKQTISSNKGIYYLSATNNNNGVSDFVEKNSLTQNGNCIMFVNQGDGGAGYSVYQNNDFISTTSNSFGYAKWVNKFTGLFISTILSKFKQKYSFGYGRTENRLKKDKILLPIDKNGKPDYKFMENFIKQEMSVQAIKVVDYYNKMLMAFERERER
ncbi:N-6 DNA methylase, partial [Campylobacter corcagiensis]